MLKSGETGLKYDDASCLAGAWGLLGASWSCTEVEGAAIPRSFAEEANETVTVASREKRNKQAQSAVGTVRTESSDGDVMTELVRHFRELEFHQLVRQICWRAALWLRS